jgi:hypothetical protein
MAKEWARVEVKLEPELRARLDRHAIPGRMSVLIRAAIRDRLDWLDGQRRERGQQEAPR